MEERHLWLSPKASKFYRSLAVYKQTRDTRGRFSNKEVGITEATAIARGRMPQGMWDDYIYIGRGTLLRATLIMK